MRHLAVAIALLASCRGGGDAPADGRGGGGSDAPPASDGGLAGTAAVSIIVEPDGNDAAQLVTAIEAAQTSVDMTMYELSDNDIINALAARAASIPVRVILDSATGSGVQAGVNNVSFNMDAFTTLQSAGAQVVWSSSAFTFTHEKTVIIDGATAWIMTMNASTSAVSSNREYLAIDTDADDVAEAEAIFAADFAHQAITPTGKLVVANTNARADLVALAGTATSTLDVEVEEFSDLLTNSPSVVAAVAAAASRGVAVRVVLANDTLDTESVQRVKLAGAQVVVTGPTSDRGTRTNPYIHAKAIVVDCTAGGCARGFVGSENFSTGSLSYNRELGVIVTAPAELAKVEAAIDTDFARGSAQ